MPVNPDPITVGEIVERLDRKYEQKKYLFKSKYRSLPDEETFLFDKESYRLNRKPFKYGNNRENPSRKS